MPAESYASKVINWEEGGERNILDGDDGSGGLSSFLISE